MQEGSLIMVKSEKIYSPQQYLETVTGNCYITNGDDDVQFIEGRIYDFVKQNTSPFEWEVALWNYPLSEIAHIVENNLNVVLVDCMVWNEYLREFRHEYRWFEVPEDFEEEEE